MSSDEDDLDRLDGGGRLVGVLARRPAGLVFASVAGACAVSWLSLAAMARRAAEIGGEAVAGPGGYLFVSLPDLGLPVFLERVFELCLTPAATGASPMGEFAALGTMWFLMSLAMMLPAAAPMIRTYCEIADTAARKGEAVVHPAILAGGYLLVWLVASLGFAGAAVALRAAGAGSAGLEPVAGVAAAASLAVAGLYQFSPLKHACLEKCRNPFATLFSRWSTRPGAILRLGMEQGLWCLGCCWALMLVMFAVGVMNLFWMALIGVFVLVEKQLGGTLSTRLAGSILLVWAAVLLVVSS